MSNDNSILRGLAGGAAGLVAMGLVMNATKRLMPDDTKRELPSGESESWSLVDVRHEGDESATAALGRIAFTKLTGKRPSTHTKRMLSQAVHWGYGLLVGAGYGLIRGRRASASIEAARGVAYGFGLWLFGDMIAVPALGLSDKPGAYKPAVHVQALAGHIAYGLGLAAGTAAVDRMRRG